MLRFSEPMDKLCITEFNANECVSAILITKIEYGTKSIKVSHISIKCINNKYISKIILIMFIVHYTS